MSAIPPTSIAAHHPGVWRRPKGRAALGAAVSLTGALVMSAVGVPAASAQPAQASPVVSAAPAGAVQPAGMLQTATSPLGAYVTSVYQDLFGRQPDPAGLSTWTAALAAGTPRYAVAGAITSSEEFRSGLIAGAYSDYLGRGPDAGGLRSWLGEMAAGMTIETMESGFTASPEYYNRAGGTNAAWVRTLYRDVLGRSAAAAEVTSWTGVLAGGGTRMQVANGFLLSTEHLRAVIDGAYHDLLGRGIDSSGQATWVGQIQSGGRLEVVIGSIVASDEYVGANVPGWATSLASSPAPDPYRAGWVLTEAVDLSNPSGWSLDTSTASNTASQDLAQNVTFGPDGLRIVGKRETTPNGSAYSSGDAKGIGHAIPNYARVEVVGRGPSATGLWPCVLWLRPLVGSVGEIDLMENFGGQARVKATLHNEYGATHKMVGTTLPWTALSNPDPEALHTYVMEKTPNRIQIWVDGVKMMDVGPADAPAGFDWQTIFENPQMKWYPRVTVQIGCGTANPTCATGTPDASFTTTDMLVTQLRIYTQAS